MGNSSLLVYGDASVDISLRIEDLPAAGLDVSARHPSVTVGGSAANCAAAAARLGVKVDLVARIGDDLFAQVIVDDLLLQRVGISGLQVVKGPSALVVALIDPQGQRTFISARGPASGRIPADFYIPLLDEATLVHVSGYAFQDRESRSAALHLLEEARRRGLSTSVDPSPLFAEHYDPDYGWLQGIDYLFPNAYEATAITGVASPRGAAKALHGFGAKAVVVTMGADGCLLNDENGVAHFPAVREFPVVDTTGAGDGFAGGFLAVTLSGGTPRQGCRVGNLVAARVIAEAGGHSAVASPGQLRRVADRSGDPQLKKAIRVLARSGPEDGSNR